MASDTSSNQSDMEGDSERTSLRARISQYLGRSECDHDWVERPAGEEVLRDEYGEDGGVLVVEVFDQHRNVCQKCGKSSNPMFRATPKRRMRYDLREKVEHPDESVVLDQAEVVAKF